MLLPTSLPCKVLFITHLRRILKKEMELIFSKPFTALYFIIVGEIVANVSRWAKCLSTFQMFNGFILILAKYLCISPFSLELFQTLVSAPYKVVQ